MSPVATPLTREPATTAIVVLPARAGPSVDPFDIPYIDPGDSHDDIDVEAQLREAEAVAEVLSLKVHLAP